MYLLSLISDFPIVGASGSCFKNTDWNPICDHSKVKTFTENWDSKAPSVGTLLAYLQTTT